MKMVGVDIGTTTVCAVVVDAAEGAVLASKTLENNAGTASQRSFEKAQNPAVILSAVQSLLEELLPRFQPISCIGISSQMHGILYLNSEGQPLSPLYTWQDQRGDETLPNGETYANALSALSGTPLATGYGAVTHFYQTVNGLVPQGTVSFCTIGDYIACALTGRKTPLTHASNAASMGMFLPEETKFQEETAEKAGMNPALFPQVTDEYALAGTTAEGIPVSVAIGDNQASFLGSVREMEKSILVNVGTGSQVSVFSEQGAAISGIEARPCVNHKFLMVGSPLCGGAAYAALERFFRMTCEMAGVPVEESIYRQMAQVLEHQEFSERLSVSTQFCGTRDCPTLRGSIENLSLSNFTPAYLIDGVLHGMVEELFRLSRPVLAMQPQPPEFLIGSGNGIRKNRYLQKLFEEAFGLTLHIPRHQEEASYGAALFAMTAAGLVPSIQQAQRLIRYA